MNAQLSNIISNIVFVLAIGYYFMTNMQWYSYKIKRVIFHHTRPIWHFVYFLFPLILYFIAGDLSIIVTIIYVVSLYFWTREQDKTLIFTGRVKRFFYALVFFALFIDILLVAKLNINTLSVIIPLFLAHLSSLIVEKILFKGFELKAKKKLSSMSETVVVGITASYGKTSIKNFLAHILEAKFRTYATPRSVNTFGGVLKDINEDLSINTEVYIVEMGARGEGDIKEISTFVNPHYAIVGKVGPAHIEYFKTMENIRNTKMEIVQSSRLKEAWIHESANVKEQDNIHIFGNDVQNINSTLDGLSFEFDNEVYKANILGSFNAINLVGAIKVARALGMDKESVQKQLLSLKQTPHRLNRMDAGGKIILDDSFNGNIDGMRESFRLASTYSGRKVVITPGLVEADDAMNREVASLANSIFDVVVVTGELNFHTFKELVDGDKLVKLESKSKMQEMLLEYTKAGDLILFANDAPSFI